VAQNIFFQMFKLLKDYALLQAIMAKKNQFWSKNTCSWHITSSFNSTNAICSTKLQKLFTQTEQKKTNQMGRFVMQISRREEKFCSSRKTSTDLKKTSKCQGKQT
jgi:hypothetical protein